MNPATTSSCHTSCHTKNLLPCHSQLPPQRLMCPGPVPPNYNPPGCCTGSSVSYSVCNLPSNPPTPTMHRNLNSVQDIISMNRGIDIRSNATGKIGNNEVSILLDDVQRSMSSTYEKIRNQYMTSEQELQELRKNRDDLSAINANMKKEITTLKRERSITSKLVDKLKKDNEVETEKVNQQQVIVAEQREELREAKEQTKSQADKITSLEEKCKDLEIKYNELFSAHVDQKVEILLGQSDRKNLTAKIAILNETVENQKRKISGLSMNRGNLLRENERLRNQLKILDLELKAEKLLKEQILKEEMDVLMKPTFLNKMLRQKCEQEQLFNLVNIKRDGDSGNSPQKGELTLAGNNMSSLVKRRYDQLIAEVESLKEKLFKDDPIAETSSQGSSLCIMKKVRLSEDSHGTPPIAFIDETSEVDDASISGTGDSFNSDDVMLVEVGADQQDDQSFGQATGGDVLRITPRAALSQVGQQSANTTYNRDGNK